MAAAERLQRLHQRLGIAATMLATAAATSIVAVLSKIAAAMLVRAPPSSRPCSPS